MTEAQIEVVFQKLLGLGCRPPKQMSTPQGLRFAVQTWAEVLADVHPQDLSNAVLRYARGSESVWWPTPGVLISLIEQGERDPSDNADEMWGMLLNQVARRGRYNAPTPEQPLHQDSAINSKLLAGVEACGGWNALCLSTQAENMANRAAFRSAYQAKGESMHTQQQIQATNRLLRQEHKIAIPEADYTKEPNDGASDYTDRKT